MTASRPLFAALCAVASLSACSLLEKKDAPACPPIQVLADTATLTQYRPGPGRDITDIVVEAEIAQYQGECVYKDEAVEVTIMMAIDASRGPANADGKADFSYYIAMPAFFPAPTAKAVFPVSIQFPENINRVRHLDEEVTMTIPYGAQDPSQVEIFLGFQLDPDQLERNRRK